MTHRKRSKLIQALTNRGSLVMGKMTARKLRRWSYWNRTVARIKRRHPMFIEAAEQRRLLARLAS